MTVEYVSMVENGHRLPTVLTLRDWARILGVRLGKLFSPIR
ncbi:MAG: helix-turn-helix transcriptional regulator [Planctomycetes bacterium]|nr:helix-turn-helix transcriptional regulator [Planctomycetota bacterium]